MLERHLMRTGRKCAAYVFVVIMLSSCSQLPDSINPVEWYNKSIDFFENKDNKVATGERQNQDLNAALAKDREKVSRGLGKEYPTVASIDQQKDYYEARKRGGLIADKENRQYAPAIARQGEISTRIAVAPPPEPKATDPEPATKVTSTESIAREKEPSKAVTRSSLPTPAEQTNLQARLQIMLNELRSRAGQPPKELLTSMSPTVTSEKFGTVFVNSEGVSTDYDSSSLLIPAQVKGEPLAAKSAVKFGGSANSVRPLATGAIKVATIHFGNGSAALSSRDRQIIASALQLKRERGGRIHIIGHASSRTRSLDPIRHKMLNFRISVDRADAVAQELIRLGVKKEDLLVDAISDSQPMYFEFMPTGEAGNRRAEIYLEG